MKRPSPHYRAVLSALTKSPQTASQIAEKANVNGRTARHHLTGLVKDGRVVCAEEFPSFLYRLK